MNTTIVLKQIINNIVIRKNVFDHVKRIHHQLKKEDSQSYKWVDIYSSFNLLVRFGYLNELKYRLENEGIDDHLYKLYNSTANNNEKKEYHHQILDKDGEEEIDHRIIGLSRIACKYGHLNIIKYFNQHHQSRYIFNKDDMTQAIENGHPEIAEYLFDNRSERYDKESIEFTARKGYHQLLDRMLLERTSLGFNTLQFGIVGSLDTLRIIHKYNQDISDQITTSAIEQGDLEIVKFINEYYPQKVPKNALWSMSKGHRDIFDYLVNNRKDLQVDHSCMTYAACSGQLELLKELHSLYRKHFDYSQAMKSQHIEILDYLQRTNNGIKTTSGLEEAAAKGNLDIIKYRHENGDDLRWIMSDAAKNGHLDIVKYLHYNVPNIECSTNTMNWAAEKGHLEVVEFLHFNRTEGCTITAMSHAINYGHLKVVKFLHQHRTEGYSSDSISQASLEVFKFIHLNRSEGLAPDASESIFIRAVNDSNIDLIKYMHTNSPSHQSALIRIDKLKNVEVVEFLMANGYKKLMVDYSYISNEMLKYMVDNHIDKIPDNQIYKIVGNNHIRSLDLERLHMAWRILKHKGIGRDTPRWSHLNSLDHVKYLRLFTRETLLPDQLFDNACNVGNLGLVDYLLSKYQIRLSSKHLGITNGHSNIVPHLYDRWNPTPKKLEEVINTSRAHNPFIYHYLISKRKLTTTIPT